MKLNQILKEGIDYVLTISDDQSWIMRRVVKCDAIITSYTSTCHTDRDYKKLRRVLDAMDNGVASVIVVNPTTGESHDFSHKIQYASSEDAVGFKIWLADEEEVNVSSVSNEAIAPLKKHGVSSKTVAPEHKRLQVLRNKGLKLPDNWKEIEEQYAVHAALTAKLKENNR
jgi:hypothetical protein